MNKTLKFPEKTRMRKASSLVAVLLLMSLPAAEAAEERWSVAEGPSGDTRGVWTMTLNGDEMSGWAEMFDAAGEPVTYFVSGKREKGDPDEPFTAQQAPLGTKSGEEGVHSGLRRRAATSARDSVSSSQPMRPTIDSRAPSSAKSAPGAG